MISLMKYIARESSKVISSMRMNIYSLETRMGKSLINSNTKTANSNKSFSKL
jgi:hypothetical protein